MFRAYELSYTLKTKVEGTPEEFCPFFELIKLQDIFEAAGSLPRIERTNPFTEWHGSKRSVYFTTGATATDEILECTVDNHFKYNVYDTPLSARSFVKEIIAEWHSIRDKGSTNGYVADRVFPKSVIHLLFILNFFKHVGFLVSNCQCVRLLQEQRHLSPSTHAVL